MDKINFSGHKKGIYLTAMIYPLWALFLSFKHFRLPLSKNLFWIFCIFLGIIHIYLPEGSNEADGYRYAERFMEFRQKPVSFDNFKASFYEEEQFIDIYQPSVTYLLSIVTGNPRWLFILFAAVFGFFYSRNIWFVLEKFPKNIGVSLILFTLFYVLICPIWEINAVRMWTALQVFVYGALPYLYNADKSKLLWCVAALFIHFSFILPLIIIFVFPFIPKSINFFIVVFVVSLFIKEINLEQVRLFLTMYTPSFLTSRVDSYTNEEYAQTIMDAKSNLNFYVEGSKMFVRWIIAVLLIASGIWGKKMIKNQRGLTNMVCFALFISSLSNIFSLIPSGGRFIILSQIFAFAAIIFFYISFKNSELRIKILSFLFKLAPVLLLFPILVMLRIGCDYYGVSLFFNPLIALFVDDNLPVIYFIKTLF